MTALPDLLRALAEREPERVRVEWNNNDPEDVWLVSVEVRVGKQWHEVYTGGDNPRTWNIWALEYAIREACDARGWRWGGGSNFHSQPYGQVTYWVAGQPHHFVQEAPTPAHALAAAYLKALGGEG